MLHELLPPTQQGGRAGGGERGDRDGGGAAALGRDGGLKVEIHRALSRHFPGCLPFFEFQIC